MIARRILGILAGILCSGLVILVVEGLGVRLLSTGQPTTPADAGTGLLLVVVAAWTLGALAGGLIAGFIARCDRVPLVVAAAVVLGVIVNAVSFPHPWWVVALGIVLPLLAGWFASRLVGNRSQRVAL